MSFKRGSQAQFEMMVAFMETKGDISRAGPGPQARLDLLQKWTELTDILNNKCCGERKPLIKWRKTWSDFKNNTKKKLKRIRKQGGQLTEVEKRMLKLIKNGRNTYSPIVSDSDEVTEVKEENEAESDTAGRSPSPNLEVFQVVNGTESHRRNSMASSAPSNKSHGKRKRHTDDEIGDVTESNRRKSIASSTSPRSNSNKLHVKRKRHANNEIGDVMDSNRRKSVASSTSAISSNYLRSHVRRIRKRHTINEVSDVTDRYFEFEKEREHLAHEREMARLKQNELYIGLFDRFLNVLETLTPSIQRYLDTR